ncbi:MAG: hypothetical protein ACK5LC_14085 [Coprobacillaceae bacterium]
MAGWRSRKNKKPEHIIEDYLVDKVEALGYWCPKWQGTQGVPDRIIFLPEQKMCFVELKREVGGKRSPMQNVRSEQLTYFGHPSFFVHTKAQVNKLVSSLKQGVIPEKI